LIKKQKKIKTTQKQILLVIVEHDDNQLYFEHNQQHETMLVKPCKIKKME